jgi:anti-sigma B factor antagonist
MHVECTRRAGSRRADPAGVHGRIEERLTFRVVTRLMTETTPERGIRTSSLSGVTVITPPVEVDHLNAAELLAALYSAADDHVVIVVDMTATEFCDSSGLAALVAAFKRARAEGGDLRLVMGAPLVRKIFKQTGVDRYLKAYESLPAALAAERSTDPPT